MSWEHGAGFRITGYVVRVFVAQSGKYASLTIECPTDRGGKKKLDVRAFGEMVDEFRNIGQGQVVQVTGTVDAESLKDKGKNEVKVDGFVKWVAALTARKVEVEPSSARTQTTLTDNKGDVSGW